MTPQTEIEILKLEKAIAELDAKWYKKQDSFKVNTKYGQYIPKMSDYYLKLVIGIVGTILFSGFCIFSTTEPIFIGVAIILIIVFIGDTYNTYHAAKFYIEQKTEYLNQRDTLSLQIKQLKNNID